jgi:hypothetical protein
MDVVDLRHADGGGKMRHPAFKIIAKDRGQRCSFAAVPANDGGNDGIGEMQPLRLPFSLGETGGRGTADESGKIVKSGHER